MIDDWQKRECVRLYTDGAHSIKDIMRLTGIRSEQTVYRILDEARVPRQKKRPTGLRASISFDEEAARLIAEARPRNLSAWVCRAVKEAYGGGK